MTHEANTHGGHSAWISPKGILEAERIRSSEGQVKAVTKAGGTLKLFVSHSSQDLEVASALSDLMRTALALRSDEIRCTSVDGYRLPVGADTNSQLRRELLESAAFIGIVSSASISSAYVLFELGARWGASLPLAPVLAPGALPTLLKGPLAGMNALRCDHEDQVHQLVEDIAMILGINLQSVASYRREVNRLISVKAKSEGGLAGSDGEAQSIELAPDEEYLLRTIVERDAYGFYVRDVADWLGWKVLKSQAVVDQLHGYKLLSISTGNSGAVYGLSVIGRRLAMERGLFQLA